MDILIRAFKTGDEPELWQVFHGAVHGLACADYTPAQIAAWAPAQPDPDQWAVRMRGIAPWVAEHEGCIVGYADLQADGYLDHFFVSPTVARRGVGSQLMQHLHRVALSRGLTRLYSNVSITARPFFERWSFRVEAAQTVNVRGETLANFRMAKELVNQRQIIVSG